MRRLFPILFMLASLGCSDGFLDDRIDALGPEATGFRPGETHRPGAPCLWCHSEYHGTTPTMSVAGTVFVSPEGVDPFPIAGITVRMVDSEGQQLDMVSNRCGNFFATRDSFEPVFPMRTELLAPDPNNPAKLLSNRPMASRISREGACGACHSSPASPFSPGVVFAVLPPGATAEPPKNCPPPNFAAQPFTNRP